MLTLTLPVRSLTVCRSQFLVHGSLVLGASGRDKRARFASEVEQDEGPRMDKALITVYVSRPRGESASVQRSEQNSLRRSLSWVECYQQRDRTLSHRDSRNLPVFGRF